MMNHETVLGALKASEAQADEVVGMVVVNDELLQQVSGGIGYGYFRSISADCWGFSCSLTPSY
jgi:hypothetical protein